MWKNVEILWPGVARCYQALPDETRFNTSNRISVWFVAEQDQLWERRKRRRHDYVTGIRTKRGRLPSFPISCSQRSFPLCSHIKSLGTLVYVVPTFIATKFFVHRDIKGVYIYEKKFEICASNSSGRWGLSRAVSAIKWPWFSRTSWLRNLHIWVEQLTLDMIFGSLFTNWRSQLMALWPWNQRHNNALLPRRKTTKHISE